MSSTAKLSEILIKGLQEKFQSQVLVDFHFKFMNKPDIGVHSVVLAAQSEVFNAMFTGPMKEHSSVEISDIEHSIFHNMLQLMYGVDASIIWSPTDLNYLQEVCDVYIAAHKYDCEIPIKKVQKWIIEKYLNLDSADTINEFASIYNDQELQVRCFEIFHEELEKILPNIQTATEFAGKTIPNSIVIQTFLRQVTYSIMDCDNLQKVIRDNLCLIHIIVDAIFKTMVDVLHVPKGSFQIFLRYKPAANKWIDSPHGVVEKGTDSIPLILEYKEEDIDPKLFLFKFTDEEKPDGRWILVHKSMVAPQSNILADIMKTKSKEFHMRDISFATFKRVIDLIYNIQIFDFNHKAAMDFYEASKKLNYNRGIIYCRFRIFKFLISNDTVDELYAFGKHHNDEQILDGCFWFASKNMTSTVESIFKDEPFNRAGDLEDVFERVMKQVEQLKKVKTLDDRFSHGIAFVKTLLQKLDGIIEVFFETKAVKIDALDYPVVISSDESHWSEDDDSQQEMDDEAIDDLNGFMDEVGDDDDYYDADEFDEVDDDYDVDGDDDSDQEMINNPLWD